MTLRSLVNRDRSQNDMNRLLQNFFGNETWTLPSTGLAFPAIDVIENDKDFKIKAEVMGMKPEDIEVTVDEGVLVIRGEKKEEREQKADEKHDYLSREISYGSFCRLVTLPDAANIEEARASFKNGMLMVDVPKRKESLQKSRKLQIGTQDRETDQAKN